MDDKLRMKVRELVVQHGYDEVLGALHDAHTSTEHAQVDGSAAHLANVDSPRRRSPLTAVEYVGRMDLPAERARTIGRAAADFERREFLPTLGDVRRFCESYGIDMPKSTSRSAGIPRVFKLLSSMEMSEVQQMLDDRLFAGPAALGPIAEAIRGRARQDRQAIGGGKVRGQSMSRRSAMVTSSTDLP